MPAFFKDYEGFLGTGRSNEQGQSLDEFLEEYDPYKYKNPCVTTDAAVLTYEGEPAPDAVWRVLLIQRRNHPSIGFWALPGGFIELGENLDATARRELEEETGVEGLALEQIRTFGDIKRDPRARIISTAYLAVCEAGSVRAQAGDDAKDARWFRIGYTAEEVPAADGWRAEVRHFTLTDESGEVCLKADVLAEERTGLVREKRYRTLSKTEIAGDHAEVLAAAWETVLGRLPGAKV
ncbi:MAG: NUDIX hydrolase [Lachnospiraceae bacterium]|nr:NUDIX hydrolase [Lachnospiraceae bacterium]